MAVVAPEALTSHNSHLCEWHGTQGKLCLSARAGGDPTLGHRANLHSSLRSLALEGWPKRALDSLHGGRRVPHTESKPHRHSKEKRAII